jgi:hypothetical protein
MIEKIMKNPWNNNEWQASNDLGVIEWKKTLIFGIKSVILVSMCQEAQGSLYINVNRY